MSRDPTTRCRYCGCMYYVEKLAAHEEICSSRPRSSRPGAGQPKAQGLSLKPDELMLKG